VKITQGSEKMGFFRKLFGLKPRLNHYLTDEERLAGVQTRLAQMDARRKTLEAEAKIAQLKAMQAEERINMQLERERIEFEEQYGSDGDNPDDLITNLFTNAFLKKNNVVAAQEMPTASQPVQLQHFSDEQIQILINSMNMNQKAVLSVLSDEQIKQMIKEKIPNVDEDSINRAVLLLRK
jgi:hypothetical protein